MKRLLKIIPLLLLSLLLCGCGAKQKDEAKIIVASDIHYIAPELIEDRAEGQRSRRDAEMD